MSQYAHPEVLIDVQWLAEHLDDSNLRILEVDMSPEPYKNAHIPGAVFWTIKDLNLPDWSLNLDPIAFEQLMSRSGITNETTVVAYSSYPGTGGWIFWLLKLFGHEKVKVLNGGYQQWQAAGYPLAKDLSVFAPTNYQAKLPDDSLRVRHQEVQTSLNKSDCVVLDVRTPQEYTGEVFFDKPPEPNQRSGHIPGALHIEHLLTLNEDGTFKSFKELQALYVNKEVTSDKKILTYCAIGARSAYVWFVLKYLLGYPHVFNYDGSWNQWSRLPHVAIEK
ncbi:MAG: sulfurtransferase [Cyanobacteria bacterium P01_G01_bin.49]